MMVNVEEENLNHNCHFHLSTWRQSYESCLSIGCSLVDDHRGMILDTREAMETYMKKWDRSLQTAKKKNGKVSERTCSLSNARLSSCWFENERPTFASVSTSTMDHPYSCVIYENKMYQHIAFAFFHQNKQAMNRPSRNKKCKTGRRNIVEQGHYINLYKLLS